MCFTRAFSLIKLLFIMLASAATCGTLLLHVDFFTHPDTRTEAQTVGGRGADRWPQGHLPRRADVRHGPVLTPPSLVAAQGATSRPRHRAHHALYLPCRHIDRCASVAEATAAWQMRFVWLGRRIARCVILTKHILVQSSTCTRSTSTRSVQYFVSMRAKLIY